MTTASGWLATPPPPADASPRKRALSDATNRKLHLQAFTPMTSAPSIHVSFQDKRSRTDIKYAKAALFRDTHLFPESAGPAKSDSKTSQSRSPIGPGDALRFAVDFDGPGTQQLGLSALVRPAKRPSSALSDRPPRRRLFDHKDLQSVTREQDDRTSPSWKTAHAQDARNLSFTGWKDSDEANSSFASTSMQSNCPEFINDTSQDTSGENFLSSETTQDGAETEPPLYGQLPRHMRTDSGSFAGHHQTSKTAWPLPRLLMEQEHSKDGHHTRQPGSSELSPAPLSSISMPVGRYAPGLDFLYHTTDFGAAPSAASRAQQVSFEGMKHASDTGSLPASVNEEITLDEADPKAIAAALHYHRTSPTQAAPRDKDKISCELCGALVIRWAILLPCNHRACSACCCSGVNQVSTTPPRRHVCAACQVPVDGLTLSFTAAEAARAAAWRGYGDEEPAVTQDGHHRRRSSFGHDLSGRFPGVTEALLGLNHPVRGRSASVVATAVSMRHHQDDCLPPFSSPNDVGPSSDPSGEDDRGAPGDSSMAFSDDASFYFQPNAAKVRVLNYKFLSPRKQGRRRDGPEQVVKAGQEYQGHRDVRAAALHRPAIPLAYKLCAVVRVDNIPWTTSYQDVIKWCPEPYELLPEMSVVAQPVHVPVDLKTGKTANCAFIELRDADSAKKLIRRRNNTKLCGRPVSLQLSNYEELRSEIFPSVQQYPPDTPPSTMIWLTAWQLDQMSRLATVGGPQLKSPLKPIELTVSWIQLLPAQLASEQRDRLFERATEVLSRGTESLKSSIDGLYFTLHRLIQACINSPNFSAAQKAQILDRVRCIPSLHIDADLMNKLTMSALKADEPEETLAAPSPSHRLGSGAGTQLIAPELSQSVSSNRAPGLVFMEPASTSHACASGRAANRALQPLDFVPQGSPFPGESSFGSCFPILVHPLDPWYGSPYQRAFTSGTGPYTGSLPHDWLSLE